MAGAPNGESVLVHALQQVYGLSDQFATYRSVYWSSKQPPINNTIEVCSNSIECLYDSILVFNSVNATLSCNLYGGGPESLNATDSVSVAIAQEWKSFFSIRLFLVLFSIQITFSVISDIFRQNQKSFSSSFGTRGFNSNNYIDHSDFY